MSYVKCQTSVDLSVQLFTHFMSPLALTAHKASTPIKPMFARINTPVMYSKAFDSTTSVAKGKTKVSPVRLFPPPHVTSTSTNRSPTHLTPTQLTDSPTHALHSCLPSSLPPSLELTNSLSHSLTHFPTHSPSLH